MSRLQWRALKRALAFSREDRTDSVAAFVEGLRRPSGRAVSLVLKTVLVFAVLLGAGFYISGYLEEQKLEQRFSQLQQAIIAERLDPSTTPNANELLQELAVLSPHDPRIEKARTDLAFAYLRRAQAARAKGEWKAARGPGTATDADHPAEAPRISRAENKPKVVIRALRLIRNARPHRK